MNMKTIFITTNVQQNPVKLLSIMKSRKTARAAASVRETARWMRSAVIRNRFIRLILTYVSSAASVKTIVRLVQ